MCYLLLITNQQLNNGYSWHCSAGNVLNFPIFNLPPIPGRLYQFVQPDMS